MSTQITQTCDRCKRSGSTNEICLRGIFVRVGTNLHDYGGAQSCHTYASEWCDNCVREVGIWPPSKDSPTPLDPPPTLEDLVRQICREETRQ